MLRKLALIGGVAVLCLGVCAPVIAAPTSPDDGKVQGLAVDIGRVTHDAESHVAGSAAKEAQDEVETEVQALIVTAAQPPAVVRDALQRVITVCIRPANVVISGITCPGNASSYAALRNVLGVVVSLLQENTGAVGPTGPTPQASTPPIQGGGGSDYRTVPN